MNLYSELIYDLLYLVYDDRLEFCYTSPGQFVIVMKGDNNADIAPNVAKLLNVFQIVGNPLFTNALQKRDMRGLRYEILSLGCNEAIINTSAHIIRR